MLWKHLQGKMRIGFSFLLGLFLLVLRLFLGCPVYRFFHIRCPGCGLTRAWLCFISGDWRSALNYHPLFLIIPIFILLFAWRNICAFKRQKIPALLDFSLYLFGFKPRHAGTGMHQPDAGNRGRSRGTGKRA